MIVNKKRLIFGIIFSLFSVLISNMHTITDVLIYVSNNSFHNLQYPLYISGYIAGPIVSISLIIFGLELPKFNTAKDMKLIKIIKFAIFLYAISHLVLSLADINYAYTIKNIPEFNYYERLVVAGTYRGISTLLTGILGITSLILFTTLFKKKDNLGFLGSILSIICVTFGILIKTLSLYFFPIMLMYTFIILMLFNGVGFVLICIGLNNLEHKS